MNKYLKKLALKIPYVKGYYEEIERYRSEIERLNSEIERLRSAGIKYYSCWHIDNFNLRFLGRVDTDKKCMCFCCVSYVNFPHIAFSETAEESVMNFAKLHADIISESIKFSLLSGYIADKDRKFTSECAKCPHFQLNNWGGGGSIHAITLSIYPSPCQCKCIYCYDLKNMNVRQIDAESSEGYEKIFKIIDLTKKNGMTARDLLWVVQSGEITIHPFKERIFNLINDQVTHFFTNCFIFDEKIAKNLTVNKQSLLCFSVDSGTPETWYKVKGVNNFKTVMENLEKYLVFGVQPEQLMLKYLILLGINDNLKDFRSIIGIMNRLEIGYMYISRDNSIMRLLGGEQRESLIKAAGYLFAMLQKNNITAEFTNYLQDEIEKITAFADELLESGEV